MTYCAGVLVPCTADPDAASPTVERDDNSLVSRLVQDECHFVNIKTAENFDGEQFMGTWYHMYR